MPESTDSRFTRRVGLFTIGTLVSRLLGLVRESVFAYLFGAGMATDAFNVAFRIPNFLRDVFAESALSAAFVPAFVDSLNREDRQRTWRFASSIATVLGLALLLIVVLGIIFAPQVVRVVALGFADEPAKFNLTVALTRIMFPFLLFVALAAWAMGILNACGTFFTPAVAPAAFNIFSALVPLLAYGWLRSRGVNPIAGMAWGVTIGALAQFLIQLPALAAHGFRFRPVLDLKDERLRRVFTRWTPVVLGFASWQVSALVNTFLLAFLPEGSVTWVNYAYRIQHLPAGLFGAAIGTVALAEFSHAATAAAASVRQRFRHAMGLVSVLTLPAAMILVALAVPVVRLVYQHGRFTTMDTAFTAQALALYSLGIWAAAAARNCAAGFFSLGDTRTPALAAAGSVALNIALNLLLMRRIGFLSFPLVTSLTQLAYFAVLFGLLRRRTGGLEGRAVVSVAVRALVAALVAAAGALLVALGFENLFSLRPLWSRLLQVTLAGGLGLIIFYLTALALHLDEVRAAFRDLIHSGKTPA
uniref:Probable lipid II flippase MurJ n=1 Tax=candidate division WOR-3 bacterium TaxID=2052148 RepID=A0A7C4GFG4_UNCW3